MKKVLIATALLFTTLPFTFDGVTPTVSKADARIGRHVDEPILENAAGTAKLERSATLKGVSIVDTL